MTFTPTEEQLAIIEAATQTNDNLLVSALAGAAKTSTLVLLAEALPADKEILCLAFNKKIALEMAERLPPHCKAMTLNSLGHRTWQSAIGKRVRVNKSKTYELLSEVLEEQTRTDKDDLFKNFGELMRHIDFGKACGYVPTGTNPTAKPLMNDEEFFSCIDEKLSALEESVIREVTLRSIKAALAGDCDFNDQIFMPTIFHGAFPRYLTTLVDEAQDLSALNHATLRKMVRDRRLIAVGDQCQAIYGFRGAHENGMDKLKQDFSMREMTLSTSFRCPVEVVKAAQWRAPHMRWPDWAKQGAVEYLVDWKASDLAEDAAIICRNNAPLFGIAIRLLRNGRTAELDGKDITRSIMKIMSKFGSNDLRQHEVMERIDAWEAAQCAKTKKRAHGRIADQAECMRVFAREGETLANALTYAQHVATLHSRLKLMTGHKSKGLEFNHVYFLDEHLVSSEAQDPNIRYVIQTRAKEYLTYIRSEGFRDNTVKN